MFLKVSISKKYCVYLPPPLALLCLSALKRHKLTGDTSVMTYRGHGVLHTLIRCRFSPEFSTGQRFIYSGCSTGKIISECHRVPAGVTLLTLCVVMT